MNAPTPLSRATDLFNELAGLQLEDTSVAQEIAQELATLCKRTGADFTSRVAYAQALLQSGNRDSALEQIDTAYGLRERFDPAPLDRLAMLLMFTADMRAVDLVKEIAFTEAEISPIQAANHTQIAAWAMDMDLLARLVEHHTNRSVKSPAAFFHEKLLSLHRIADVRLHQELTINLMKEFQVAVCFAAVQDDGDWIFSNNMFFDRNKIGRRKLEDLADDLISEKIGNDIGLYITNVFTPAPAGPALNVFKLRPVSNPAP